MNESEGCWHVDGYDSVNWSSFYSLVKHFLHLFEGLINFKLEHTSFFPG